MEIQKLTYALTKKKAELREEKLKEEYYTDRSHEQEDKISNLKIAIDHELERENDEVRNKERLVEQQNEVKGEMREQLKRKTEYKEEITEMIPVITEEKEHCEELEQAKKITEANIKENKLENQKLHEQIQNLEEITTYVQRTIRDRQEKISSQKIEEY